MDIFDTIKNYRFFSIIRNPIDQTISYYNFTKNYPSIPYSNYEFNKWIKVDTNITKNSVFILDKNNKIPSNFTLIDFNNLQAGLTPFFKSLGIPEIKLMETSSLYQTDIRNASIKHFVKNNEFLYNDFISNLLNNKDLFYDYYFIIQLQHKKKTLNF